LLNKSEYGLRAQPVAAWGPAQAPPLPTVRLPQAARDKAAYEASFGPFYRVEQLILTTTADSASKYVTQSGLPSIVTEANIRLLFDIQAEVDAITGALRRESIAPRSAYPPNGTHCAQKGI
jgi:Niemann-Pick C1 protein